MSPEQALGKTVDRRTDIFSFGVVLYEMATGRQPFTGETTAAVFNEILNKPPIAPVRLNPGISSRLEEIINRSMEKEAAMRYQSAADLMSDLERLRRDLDTTRTKAVTAPAAAPAVSHGRSLMAIGSAVLAAAVVLVVYLVWQAAPTDTIDSIAVRAQSENQRPGRYRQASLIRSASPKLGKLNFGLAKAHW